MKRPRITVGLVFALTTAGLVVPANALAQSVAPFAAPDRDTVPHVGWSGFADLHFVLTSLGALVLATLLGAIVAYHPAVARTIDTPQEAEVPRALVLYAVVGAVIGVMVLTFGMGVGIVVFGIGGLIRFRTDAGSTRDTGRLILVTLVGLASGLGLPHFAVLTALFAFVLIHVLESRVICRVVIKNLPTGQVAQASASYRRALELSGCVILSERKALAKQHASFVLRAPRHWTPESMDDALADRIPEGLRGVTDWEVE